MAKKSHEATLQELEEATNSAANVVNSVRTLVLTGPLKEDQRAAVAAVLDSLGASLKAMGKDPENVVPVPLPDSM